MIQYDSSKFYKPIIVFQPDDIIFKDEFVNARIKENDVWFYAYPSSWSQDKGDAYYNELREKYDWQAIYELYRKYLQLIVSQPERLNGKTPTGDAKV